MASIGLACDRHRIPPTPKHWLTDQVGYLSIPVAEKLDRELRAFQDASGHHVLVYITDEKLEHEPIEEFCIVAFNAWGVGRAGHDDGVVLFVFPKADRLRMRIQVGYGLERVLSDREAVRILREIIGPKLEAGQHDEGIEAGVAAILAEIGGA
jgi:uncharacterized protein